MKEKSGLLKDKARFVFSMLVFGSLGVFVRSIHLSSGIIAFFRGIIGALFLFIFILIKRIKISAKEIKQNILTLIITGAFIGINWILLFEAYRFTTVATATLCYYLEPVFVIIASPIFLKEKISVQKILCVFGSLIGMGFISGVFTGTVSGGSKGIILSVSAAFFYACVVIINKRLKPISPYVQTAVQLFSASVIFLPYLIINGSFGAVVFSLKTLALLLIVGIVHTGVSYVCYFSALKNIKAQTAAVLSFIDPAAAVIFSALLLSEKISLATAAGAVFILGSALLCEIGEKKD